MSETLQIPVTMSAQPEGMKLGNSPNSVSTPLPGVVPELDTPFVGAPSPELAKEVKATVKRSNGEMENDWDLIGRFAQEGGTVVKVSKPTEDGRFLTRTIPAQEYDSWQTQPAEASPEIDNSRKNTVMDSLKDVEATNLTTPEDFRRIESETKDYFDLFEDPEDVLVLRQQLAEHSSAVQTEMQKQLQELGFISGNPEANGLVTEKIQEVVMAATAKKAAELVEQGLEYESTSRGEKKEVNQARESLTKLLSMPAEEFDRLKQDWKRYEMDKLHSEAYSEDKEFKVGEQRRVARGEVDALDQKYGGVLAEINHLPLDREPGGATFATLDGYARRQQKIDGINSELIDKETLKEVNIAQTAGELQASLKAKYQAEGLSEEQIQAKLAESAPSLETWLKHIDSKGLPLADLEKYGNQSNKEKMLSQRRQKASEYIGSVLLIRSLHGVLNREKSPDLQPEVSVSEVFERGIDHNDSRARAGAEAMQDPEKASSFMGRVIAQLETARNLSQNEGTLMKSLIYITAIEKSLGDGFITAWEAIPEEKKKQARKKIMLGMAVTASTLSKMSARVAAKARKTAATGASAGTIWLGSKVRG